MKKVKILVASVLFCVMGYTGYTVHEKMTLSEAEKLMNANVEALTRGEGDSGSGRALCYSSYTLADNNQVLRCVTCDYVNGIGSGRSGYCRW